MTYYTDHKEHCLEVRKDWYARNRDRKLTTVAAYYYANRAQILQRQKVIREARKSAMRCQACGRRMPNLIIMRHHRELCNQH